MGIPPECWDCGKPMNGEVCDCATKPAHKPLKSPLKYHGGKFYLAKKIISLLPPRGTWQLWREPYFGGGSVTFALDPDGISEAVNDIDGELTNFWMVLRDTPDRMLRALWATPLSQDMFENSADFATQPDRVRRATQFFIRCRQSRQGLMQDFATPTSRVRRGMNENVSAWLSAVDGLPEIHERLSRIEIRNMDACDFIRKYDHPRAVFYLDPPYLHDTRVSKDVYRHEMSFEDHGRLLAVLGSIEGKFLLSGYPSEVYDEAADAFGWNRVDISIDNKASSKKTKDTKTECIWRNYGAEPLT